MSATPQHGSISGYVNDDCRWIYSVWDANLGDWCDVSEHRDEALRFAESLPAPRRSPEG